MFSAFTIGPWLIAAALAVVAYRYYRAANAGNLTPPFVINQGAAMTAIQNAVSGNAAAALTALIESVHLQVAAGSIEEKLFQAGFKELELRAADPNAKLPIMDYIAHFSNRPRDQVIAFFEAEAGIARQTPVATVPVTTPAVQTAPAVAAALLFCLLLAPPASAAHPSGPSHWHADVHAPQTFYPTELKLIGDCNLPDPGPNIFIDYFYADWCSDCGPSTKYANQLDRAGQNVILRNAGTKDGSGYARACRVTTVPFWLVREDGREVLRTNNAREVATYLSNKQANSSDAAYQPVSLTRSYAGASEFPVQPPEGTPVYQPIYYQPAYQQQQIRWWDSGPMRRWISRGPVRRFLFGRC